MIEYVKVINHLGETLTIELRNPEKSGFFVRRIDGLGPSKSVINMTDVLSADGSFYNSSRVTSRNIVMELGFYDEDPYDVETLRQQTYRFFPMKRALEIEVQTDNRLGYTIGYVETNEPNIFSKEETTVISILCTEAFFFGRTPVQTVFSGVASAFEFPFENTSLTEKTIVFGNVFIDTQKSVFYTGDEETGVIIYITINGPVNDLSVHNATRGQTMNIDSAKLIALTGSDLIAGDRIVISTIKGYKSIILTRNGVPISLLNALGTNADWFTIDRGDNVFTYTADSGLANLQFMIEHQIVYGGL